MAIVTGISSGIGMAVARELAQGGFRVFGSVRSPHAEIPPGAEPLVLDVRDEASIEAGVALVLARAGRIDVLVNNAGAAILGAIEETDLVQAQELFDVNFFGAVRMTQRVLPTMRAQHYGRIVFVSSLVGLIPAPFMGFYAASKHALEGYSESLDHEVRRFGVRTLLVEPGFTRTKFDQKMTHAAHPIDDYDAARTRVGASIAHNADRGDDPTRVAKVVAAALKAEHPKLRYPIGRGARAVAGLRRILPAPVFDRSFRHEFGLDRDH